VKSVRQSKRFLRGTVAAVAVAATASTVTAADVPKASHASSGLKASPGAAPAPVLVFDKNPRDPSNSRLSIQRNGKVLASWRAGSGDGSQNPCYRNHGWMPTGTWKINSRSQRYNGRLIKGYAVHLQDMACKPGSGVKRTEMFIHSEMNRDGSQGGVERRRWDGPGDYRSNGCVKLAPADIKDLFRRLNQTGWPSHLRVVN
jgi:lipoprotein-anchoring transpeptidase ErfK/SrfK